MPTTTAAVPTSAPTAAPGDLTQLGAIIARVPLATGNGNKDLEVIRDGDMPPAGTNEARRQYDTNDGRNESDEDWIGYAFATPQTFTRVLFQEGVHFSRGGWFSTLTVHVRQGGIWSPVSSLTVAPPYPGVNDGVSFETYDITFSAIKGDAIRIWGRPGGKDDFISVGELRVYGPSAPASPAATATPVRTTTATATPVRTSTPVPTATEPPIAPTAHPTATAIPTAQPTADPTVAATPAPGLCGNGVQDAGEQCDGAAGPGCVLCLADCTCGTRYTFPLDGWSADKGRGPTARVTVDAEAGDAPVLVVDPVPGTNGELSYPARASLELPFPMLSFTGRTGDGSRLQVTVRAVDGRMYQLGYEAKDGVPLAAKRQSSFPIGRVATFRTTLRDLKADLHAAFNVDFAAVEQVTVRGPMSVADITIAAPGVLPVDPTPAAEIALPTNGWSQQGAGTVVENEYDTELSAPTIRTEPRDPKRAKIAVSFPKRDMLAAAYRTFSLVVRDEQKLAIEVRVRVKRGIARLRYEAGLEAPIVKGRKTTLPLVATPVDGSAYRLVTIDLASDLARVLPGASLDGVLGIRVQGKFRMGDVVLREPMAR